MKVRNYLLDHLWPFSSLRRLRRDLANQRSLHADYREWAEKFYSLVQRTLPSAQFTTLLTQYNRDAEEECAMIGRRSHAGQKEPDPRSRIGYPTNDFSHVTSAIATAEAARADQRAEKEFGEMWEGWQGIGSGRTSEDINNDWLDKKASDD